MRAISELSELVVFAVGMFKKEFGQAPVVKAK
jgi:hypothetical protein